MKTNDPRLKGLFRSFATACSILVFAGFSCDINIVLPEEPEPEPTEVCETNRDCDDGDLCINGECEVTPPPLECYDDSECGPNQYCDVYTTMPAPEDCYEAEDGTTNCADTAARMRPAGTCQDYDVPPPGCYSDSDCAPDEFCVQPYDTYPRPDCGPEGDCGYEDMPVYEGGYCEPRNPPQGCTDDADCGPGFACFRDYTMEECEECSPAYEEYGYCGEIDPPHGECNSDWDCGPDAYCEVYEYCDEMPYPCGPEGDCYTEPAPCEVYSQCVPLNPPDFCIADEDCGPGYRCLMGEPTPAGLIAGQCIPDDVTDCEEQCLWEIDSFLDECLNGSFAGEQECFEEAEWLMNQCVDANCGINPPPYECSSDSDCAAGDICVYDGYGPFPGDDPDQPDFRPAPYGICVPGEPNCENQCFADFDELLNRCETIDVDWATCQNDAERALDNCLSTCFDPPPPPPLCEERCEQEYFWFMEECAAAGDSRSCAQQAEAAYGQCLDTCFDLPPPPPPVCEDECFARYDDVFMECLDQGQDPSVCDQIATPILNACFQECGNTNPGECQTNDDCGQGGTCQTIEWCEATPSPCLGGPNGEGCPEPMPCLDENGDGICDGDDFQCGTESICVYDTEPGPPIPDSECTADSECESGSCVVRTSCFFYCDVNDAECCFDVGQCEVVRPDAP